MKRRFLSTLLAFCMVLSLLSETALAGYYGDTLTGATKEFYHALEQNPDVIRKGEAVNVTLQSGAGSTSELKQGIIAFHYDHPQVFWFAFRWHYRYNGNNWQVTLPFGGVWTSNVRSLSADEAAINRTVKRIAAEARKRPAQDQQLRYVHDWLTENNTYNDAAAIEHNYSGDPTPWSVAGALLPELSPVCEGYSHAFKMICDELGIECITVSGGGHMWNYVRLNGSWYAVDVTWDDTTGYPSTDEYFLVGSNTLDTRGRPFYATHIPENQFTHPKLSEKSYKESAPKTCTLTFDPNGGKVSPSSKEYKANDKLGTLPTPTRTGYKFDGWYTSVQCSRNA